MPIRLPPYDQVVFQDSPLEAVICQLRFHQILKMNTAPPAQFQDRIRETFPVFAEERGFQIGVAGPQPVLAMNEPAWQFKTPAEDWTVSLTSSLLALKAVRYSHFAEFLDRFLPVVASFEEIYTPPFYVRVGLRYVNRFFAEITTGRSVAWHDILNPHLSGASADPVLQDGIVESKHQVLLSTDHGQISWRYSRDVGHAERTPAERFTLDLDHFTTGQVRGAELRALLTGFNDSLYRLFRWCLTPKGYESLRPVPKQGGVS